MRDGVDLLEQKSYIYPFAGSVECNTNYNHHFEDVVRECMQWEFISTCMREQIMIDSKIQQEQQETILMKNKTLLAIRYFYMEMCLPLIETHAMILFENAIKTNFFPFYRFIARASKELGT